MKRHELIATIAEESAKYLGLIEPNERASLYDYESRGVFNACARFINFPRQCTSAFKKDDIVRYGFNSDHKVSNKIQELCTSFFTKGVTRWTEKNVSLLIKNNSYSMYIKNLDKFWNYKKGLVKDMFGDKPDHVSEKITELQNILWKNMEQYKSVSYNDYIICVESIADNLDKFLKTMFYLNSKIDIDIDTVT